MGCEGTYGQIGPHQETTSYSLERCHLALIFVNCFRNKLLAVSVCVGEPYPLNTIYQLIRGLQCQFCDHGRANIKLDNPAFHDFCSSLDGEMKRLNASGEYINKKQAQLITVEQESHLWDLRLLGDHNPQTLLSTTVFQVGLLFFFALRSGN